MVLSKNTEVWLTRSSADFLGGNGLMCAGIQLFINSGKQTSKQLHNIQTINSYNCCRNDTEWMTRIKPPNRIYSENSIKYQPTM